MFATNDNRQAQGAYQYPPGAVGESAPVTIDFAPVKTSAIRVVMDACTTIGGICAGQGLTIEEVEPVRARCPPGHGWLYEVEVFALP